MSFAVRNSRFPHMCRASRRFPYMCRALLRFPHLSFIPPVPYPPLRGTFPLRGRLCLGYCFSTHACIRSDDMEIALLSQMAYLRRSFPLFFIPLVPYPARSARHLPHAGKALCQGQRHSHKCRACILRKQKPLCEDWLSRAVSGSIILRSRILRDFSAYPHHFLS